MCQASLEIMEPEINKIKDEAKKEERQKGINRNKFCEAHENEYDLV